MAVMTLTELINAVNRRIDDVVSQTDAYEWFNAAKNKMALEVKAKFPDLDTTNTTTFPFVFDDIYWELPVIYAAQKFKERDVMLDEARMHKAQFEDELKYFVENYDRSVMAQYRNDGHSQQFVAAAGQLAYRITKPYYDPLTGDLKVFINGIQSTDFTVPASSTIINPTTLVSTNTTTNDPNGFVFNTTTTININDKITATWDIHDDLMEPPYQWWGSW